MNKTLIIVLVIVVAVILGFGVYQWAKAPSLPEGTTVPMAAGTGGETGFTTSPSTPSGQ